MPFSISRLILLGFGFSGISLLWSIYHAYVPMGFFMLAIIAMLPSMDLFRTPVITLMPDITPSPQRSQANGVI